MINADYIQVSFTNDADLNEILPALLMQLGFDSFLEEEKGITGYIVKESFDEQQLREFLAQTEITQQVTFKAKEQEKKNWNEQWEQNFDPVFIDDQVVIKAPFHQDVANAPLTILIEPKMSFGTGHHETTELMIRNLMTLNPDQKSVADIGSGTGVLAIAALKLGAKFVDACDVDEWSSSNTEENKQLNNVTDLKVFLGDVTQIISLNKTYDITLANINKNILLNDMNAFSDITRADGHLILSGFYETDTGDLLARASEAGFKEVSTISKNNWTSIILVKK